MKRILFFLLIASSVFGNYATPDAESVVLSGGGTFTDPFICPRGEFYWNVTVPDEFRNEQYLMAVEVHIDGYRNCSTIFYSGNMSWQDAENTTFYFDGFQTGQYYFRLSAKVESESGTGKDVSTSSRMHVYFQRPGWNPPDSGVTYKQPSENQPIDIRVQINDYVSGSGTANDPIIFAGDEIDFSVILSDPDGDFSKGAAYWCFERRGTVYKQCLTNPHRYLKSQGDQLAAVEAFAGTYDAGDMLLNESFNFLDPALCLVADYYLLVVDACDEHGLRSMSKEIFVKSGGEEIQDGKPSPPKNFQIF